MPHRVICHAHSWLILACLSLFWLYFQLLSTIFTYIHFLVFLHLIAILLGSSALFFTICKTSAHAYSAPRHISAHLDQLPVPTWFKYHKPQYIDYFISPSALLEQHFPAQPKFTWHLNILIIIQYVLLAFFYCFFCSFLVFDLLHTI